MPATRKNKTRTQSNTDDTGLSAADWGKLSLEALRLKCNQYRLITAGSKYSIQKRLYDHFHPSLQTPAVQPTQQTTPTPIEPSMSDVLTKLRKIQTQVNELRNHQQNVQPGGGGLSSTSWQQTTDPQQMFTSAAIRPQFSVPENTPLLNSCIDHTEPTQRSISSAIPAALQGGGPELEGNFTPNLNFNLHNQYTPPPIKSSLLKKINNSEYIDFDELLPHPPAITTDSFFGLEMDKTTSSLTLKQNKPKAKIRDFSSWMLAWNMFYQTVLFTNHTCTSNFSPI